MRMQKGANQGSIYRVAERRSAVHFPRNSLEKKKNKDGKYRFFLHTPTVIVQRPKRGYL